MMGINGEYLQELRFDYGEENTKVSFRVVLVVFSCECNIPCYN